jgi:hypothetical protein
VTRRTFAVAAKKKKKKKKKKKERRKLGTSMFVVLYILASHLYTRGEVGLNGKVPQINFDC